MSSLLWRFSNGESCAIFWAVFKIPIASPELSDRKVLERIPVYLEVFKMRVAIKVAPAKGDEPFFAWLVEQELARLATLEPELGLGCGHTVFSHRHFLQEFRNRYGLSS